MDCWRPAPAAAWGTPTWRGAHGETAHVAFALLLFGFAVKVGGRAGPGLAAAGVLRGAPGRRGRSWPGRRSTSASTACGAPSTCSAPAPAWLAVVVLVLAGVTAVLGIAHGAVHPDLRGLVGVVERGERRRHRRRLRRRAHRLPCRRPAPGARPGWSPPPRR
ncbi:MAG: hypothetical protein QM747_20385 [Nocardioides sp.]